MWLLRLSGLVLGGSLASCAAPIQSEYCTLASTTGLPVIHPDKFGIRIITSQKVDIRNNDQHFEFYSQIEISDPRLVIVGLSSIGQKLFQVSYQHGSIEMQDTGVPLPFDPAYMLTDISLMYAPAESLNRCIAEHKLPVTFMEQPDANSRVFAGPLLSATVEFKSESDWPAQIHYVNKQNGYTINILTLSKENL